MAKPVLRVSGEYYGCIVTKESFSNYHFRVQFQWGEKKWEPRLNEPKDSGILYHSRGDYGVEYWKSWALSHEFQIIEHGLGEYWTQSTSAMTIRATPGTPGAQDGTAPRWHPEANWTEFVPPNNHAMAGSDEEQGRRVESARSHLRRRPLPAHREWQGGHGVEERALQGR